jgi:hypothetical protein
VVKRRGAEDGRDQWVAERDSNAVMVDLGCRWPVEGFFVESAGAEIDLVRGSGIAVTSGATRFLQLGPPSRRRIAGEVAPRRRRRVQIPGAVLPR